MKLRPLLLTVLALGLAAPVCAIAAPEVVRSGPAAAPISGDVVVRNVGGADFAYASGVPGAATAGDTHGQTIDALTKLLKGLHDQGFEAGDIVMMRVFLVADPATGKMDFAGMNSAFAQFFGAAGQPNKPSRTTVQITALAAPGSLVEIEAQAVKEHR